MSKKNGLLMLAIGAAGGYLAAKYGKQVVNTVKGSIDRQPIEDLVEEIKKSVKQGADEIKKSVEDICGEIEKSYFDDSFMSMSTEDFADVETTHKEPNYVKVPVTDVEEDIVKDTEVEEILPPVDVVVSDKPEEVRKVVEETLAEAEQVIAEEIKPVESAAEVLKKRRSNIKKAKKSVTAEVEVKEEVSESTEEVKDVE